MVKPILLALLLSVHFSFAETPSCLALLLVEAQDQTSDISDELRKNMVQLSENLRALDEAIAKLPTPTGRWIFRSTLIDWANEYMPLYNVFVKVYVNVLFWAKFDSHSFREAFKTRPELAHQLIEIIKSRCEDLKKRKISGVWGDKKSSNFEKDLDSIFEWLGALEKMYPPTTKAIGSAASLPN